MILHQLHNALIELGIEAGYLTPDDVKARRIVPKNRINPDGAQMRRFERELQAATLAGLEKQRRFIFRGVSDDNAQNELERRLSDPALSQIMIDALLPIVQAIATSGADFGRLQIERDVLGTRKALSDLLSVDWSLVNNRAAEWALNYVGDMVRGIDSTTIGRVRKEVNQFVTSGGNDWAIGAATHPALWPKAGGDDSRHRNDPRLC